jgi:tyrosinase
MLDRVWWIWQMQDPDNRVNAVPGQAAMPMNHPMKREHEEWVKRQGQKALKDVIVELGWTAPPVPLMDLNDLLGGNSAQFCYIYV